MILDPPRPFSHNPWTLMWQALKPHKFWLFAFICAFSELVVTIAKFSLSYVIDDVVTLTSRPEALTWQAFEAPFMFVAAIGVLIILFNFIDGQAWRLFCVPFQSDLTRKLFNYTQQKPAAYFMNNYTGQIAQKITEVPRSALLAVDAVIYSILRICFGLAVGVSMLMAHHIIVGSVAFFWFLFFLAFSYYTGRICCTLALELASHKGHVSGRVVDSISNIFNVKFFARSTYESTRLDKTLKTYINSGDGMFRFQRNMVTQAAFIGFLFLITTAGAILYTLLEGMSTIAETATAFTLLILTLRSFENLPYETRKLMREIGCIDEGLTVLFGPRQQQNSCETQSIRAKTLRVDNGEIAFDNVTFSYNGKDKLFDGLTLKIPAGQRVGLIGPSGAGKSSLISVLLRLFAPQSGQITIDGQPLQTLTAQSLCENIAFIPQDTSLFHRSLMENIRYGCLEATDEDIIAAAQKAHAHDFITALPEGYNTLVGDRGIKLSGGQRQRIAIARAILKNAPILILDEATSALDSESEKLIQASLKKLMENKTVIAIAHRLSTISHLDRLIVIDHGQILEDGSHDELLQKTGLYAKLWAMQSGGFLGEESEK